MKNSEKLNIQISVLSYRLYLCLIFTAIFLSACAELEKPKPEPFYSQTAPPQKKEFRWSNGKMPKSFDPALASAPPETDVVRAIFEGLTDTDPKTLEAVPAVAEKWTSSEDFKTWTFYLRKDAIWSNGEPVTAEDFVRSWRRLAELGEKVAHRYLLQNIVGMQTSKSDNREAPSEEFDALSDTGGENSVSFSRSSNVNRAVLTSSANPKVNFSGTSNETQKSKTQTEVRFGVEAIDDKTLKVMLINPDREFPLLVAHPIFRPIYGDGKDFEGNKLNAHIVTNGAFQIASVGQDGVTLDRAEYFWEKEKIELERVRFVPQENAEKALAAYRQGEVDAVTNAHFEPLARKLLEPFHDFRQITHGALNFYEFNIKKPPFDRRQVREALAIAIERERLIESEMGGAVKPAFTFLPFDFKNDVKLVQDKEKAKKLLAEAGFPNGENFPRIRLVINRNHLQQRIANSIARMWEQNLNIKTDVIIKESGEIENIRKTGDFDLLRRGVVLATANETIGMLAILSPSALSDQEKSEDSGKDKDKLSANKDKSLRELKNSDEANTKNLNNEQAATFTAKSNLILTEEQALAEIPAIPLYFPISFSLIKPYVQGFEINTLDAHSLKNVRIDNTWQPKKPNSES
jgi:oligopeptide transport system substrate-binding protein